MYKMWSFFDKNRVFKKNLTNVDATLQDVSVPETIFNGKLLIFKLLSFSFEKIRVVPTRVSRLKIAPNMADPTSIKDSVNSLKSGTIIFAIELIK